MLAADARVDTDRASRYLTQLCRHASAMGARRAHGPRMHMGEALAHNDVRVTVEWTDTHGVLRMDPWGTCTVDATATALVLRAEADDEVSLRCIQDIVTRDIDRFGRRDQLTVRWQSSDSPDQLTPAPMPTRGGRRHRRGAITLAATGVLGVALTIATHVGLGGALVAGMRWLDWTGFGLIAVPLIVIGTHVVAPLSVVGLRRRIAARRH
jgi:hypothetical protein